MRVLYVIDSLAPGGAETSLLEMTPALTKAGTDLHILPLGNRFDLGPALSEAGASIHRRVRRRPSLLSNIRDVREVALELEPGLIHTTLYEANVSGRLAGLMVRTPTSSSLVSNSYDASHYREATKWKLDAARLVDAATARSVVRFHAVSQAVAEGVGRRLAIPRAKIDVIPRGRDPERLPYKSAELRTATRTLLGLPEHASVILAVGRHEPAKGLMHLLRSLETLCASHPDINVLIAGKEGRSTGEIEGWLRQSRNPCPVRLLGHREDVPALMAAADVLCFPSEREGSPGTLIEAMAVGCRIVASDIAPNREVLGGEDPVGALVDAADPRCLAEELERALGGGPSVQGKVERARRRFETNYTVDVVGARMSEFFQRAASENHRFGGKG